MPDVRATRTLPAASAAVWKVAADPYRLPGWWPHVVRVEDVSGRGFTEVRQSARGRQVRADFRVTEHEQGRRRTWTLQVAGSPFERVFRSSAVALALDPRGAAETTVTLELRQRLRGASRLGAPLVRRGSKRMLVEALDGLADMVGEPGR